MTEDKTTPRPWETCERGDYSDDGIVILGDDIRVAVANTEADAAFIVTAVNAHDDLVEALIEARKQLEAYELAATGETYNSPSLNAALRLAGVKE